MESGSPFVQIATWNGWSEGTAIEPSQELGYRDLETVQNFRRKQDAYYFATLANLRLPLRLWKLRKLQAVRPDLKPKTDSAARLLGTGDYAGAGAAMKRIEILLKGNHRWAFPDTKRLIISKVFEIRLCSLDNV